MKFLYHHLNLKVLVVLGVSILSSGSALAVAAGPIALPVTAPVPILSSPAPSPVGPAPITGDPKPVDPVIKDPAPVATPAPTPAPVPVQTDVPPVMQRVATLPPATSSDPNLYQVALPAQTPPATATGPASSLELGSQPTTGRVLSASTQQPANYSPKVVFLSDTLSNQLLYGSHAFTKPVSLALYGLAGLLIGTGAGMVGLYMLTTLGVQARRLS
jgi:hypothetical protein